MSDFAVQMQARSRTIISSTDLLAGPGQCYTAWDATVVGDVDVAGREPGVYVPILIHQPYTAQTMFAMNGVTVSGNIDVGIYTEAGVQLISSGSTAQAGSQTLQSFNITDTLLLPGVYYIACAMNNTTAQMQNSTTFASPHYRAAGVLAQSSAFALPNPATFAAVTDIFCPIVGIVGQPVSF